jgi:hypothetical protein
MRLLPRRWEPLAAKHRWVSRHARALPDDALVAKRRLLVSPISHGRIRISPKYTKRAAFFEVLSQAMSPIVLRRAPRNAFALR